MQNVLLFMAQVFNLNNSVILNEMESLKKSLKFLITMPDQNCC